MMFTAPILDAQRAKVASALEASRLRGRTLLAPSPAGVGSDGTSIRRCWPQARSLLVDVLTSGWGIKRLLKGFSPGQLSPIPSMTTALTYGVRRANHLLRPVAARSPWVLLGAAAAAGAVVTLARPRRLVRWAVLWALPYITSEVQRVLQQSIRSMLSSLLAPASEITTASNTSSPVLACDAAQRVVRYLRMTSEARYPGTHSSALNPKSSAQRGHLKWDQKGHF